ncbi:MAG: dual specificity protein phosphatase family protein [Legionellales bacterium]|nr:dual specificity protein phosphatase family protein [Legionellales bacterium]
MPEKQKPDNFHGIGILIDPRTQKPFKGKIFGSQQPGYDNAGDINDNMMLANILNSQLPLNELQRKFNIDNELLQQLQYIKEEDIGCIYSLSNEESDRKPALLKKLWETYFGIQNKSNFYHTELYHDGQFISTAIEDFKPPSLAQLLAITRDSVKMVRSGENVLVHCGYGAGRTGTVLSAIYMAVSGCNDKDAIKYIRANYNDEAVERTEQEKVLAEFHQELGLKAIEYLKKNFASSHNSSEIIAILSDYRNEYIDNTNENLVNDTSNLILDELRKNPALVNSDFLKNLPITIKNSVENKLPDIAVKNTSILLQTVQETTKK